MSIPIKRYIDSTTRVVSNATTALNYNGLVFTSEEMIGSDSRKTDYNAGKVIGIAANEITKLFSSTGNTAKFATKYFGWTNVNGRAPSTLYVCKTKIEDASLADSFTNALNLFSNFRTFTFIDSDASVSGSGGLVDVQNISASFGRRYLMSVVATAETATTVSNAFKGKSGVIITLGLDNTDSYIPMAYSATLDYSASSTGRPSLMYRTVPTELALVTSETDADKYDNMRINYGANVQTMATNRNIYQMGVNADGEDTGVYLDSIWVTANIEDGWLNLAIDNGVIPASSLGVSKIYAMIYSVVTQGLDNGVILTGKTLGTVAMQEVIELTGDEENIQKVENYGYYLNVWLTKQNQNGIEVDVANYLLIYSKGDSIKKVSGSHVLV